MYYKAQSINCQALVTAGFRLKRVNALNQVRIVTQASGVF